MAGVGIQEESEFSLCSGEAIGGEVEGRSEERLKEIFGSFMV